MTEREEQRLNEKIAKWLHFEDRGGHEWILTNGLPVYIGRRAGFRFTHSLDALFTWVVPKLDKARVFTNDAPGGDRFFNGEVWLDGHRGANTEETPALALCRAIEELIDGGAA